MSNSTVKKLGFWSIVLFGVNSIIGTGIFLTPGDVIKQAGTLAPVSYIIAGIFATIIGMVFATAAKYVKKNGAGYAYTTAAFGPKVGIYVGVTRAIAASIAWGVLATAVV
ncbi:MAG: amino acid permease, partial [Culicoidibacterales bacterium]